MSIMRSESACKLSEGKNHLVRRSAPPEDEMSVGGILHGGFFQSLSKPATAALRPIAAAARGVQVLGFDPVLEMVP
jgi:hypothetical protein